MSLNVFFFILNESSEDFCYRYACRLVEKYYSENKKIYIHVPSMLEAQKMDDLLWTFHDVSFIPHEIKTSDRMETSVLIGCDDNLNLACDVLFNLTLKIPPFFAKFSDIVEVIPNDENAKIEARKRYKHYRNKGCVVKVDDFSLSQS